jgi:hypothetical protein
MESEWNIVGRRRGWNSREKQENGGMDGGFAISGKKHKSFAEAAKNGWKDKGNDQGGGEEKGLKELEMESRIKPRFKEQKNQLVVRPAFYNGRKFAGFVSHLEAKHKLYNEAMGLNCSDLHGIGFIRDSEDSLLIVFKLNCNIEISSIKKLMNTQELTEQEKKTGLNVKLSTGLMDRRRRAWMKL